MSEQFIGQVIADKYRVDSFIHQTGERLTFHGTQIPIDKQVTIQVLTAEFAFNEESVKRFSDEMHAAQQISNVNILNVIEFGIDPREFPYAVYEGTEGRPLDEILTEDAQFSVERAADIARQSAAGLTAAHSGGIIHGNLNPRHILVFLSEDSTDSVKVTDFGMKPDPSSKEDAEYLSPEQISGAAPDGRSDVYSLGAIMYRLLAGQIPFSGETRTDIAIKHIEEPLPPLSMFRGVSNEVEAVIVKAMAKNPDSRYQTAHEFAIDLDTAVQKGPAAGTSENNVWKTAFVVLAGISLLAAALIYGTSIKRTEPTTRLQADANGQPVQPLNPATGLQEDSLANMQGMSAEVISNSNMSVPPGTLPGGDGYNAWANGGIPPAGAPPSSYVGPGGQVITIDPNNPSQFMPNESGIVLVPVPANTNAAVKASPTPKSAQANANVGAPPTVKATPAGTPAVPKTDKTPEPKPKVTAAPPTSKKDKPEPAVKSTPE
ncbi:MAG: protein kinase [Pyrinomonadaceae bacterium]